MHRHASLLSVTLEKQQGKVAVITANCQASVIKQCTCAMTDLTTDVVTAPRK